MEAVMGKPLVLTDLVDDASLVRLMEMQRKASDPNLRQRATIVLASSRGMPAIEIAVIVGRTHKTILNIMHRYMQLGVDGLARTKSPGGNRVKVTTDWTAKLNELVELDPREHGVPSANWTTLNLQEVLKAKTGITVHRETVRKHLRKNDWVCKRSTWSLKRKAAEKADYEGNASGRKSS